RGKEEEKALKFEEVDEDADQILNELGKVEDDFHHPEHLDDYQFQDYDVPVMEPNYLEENVTVSLEKLIRRLIPTIPMSKITMMIKRMISILAILMRSFQI